MDDKTDADEPFKWISGISINGGSLVKKEREVFVGVKNLKILEPESPNFTMFPGPGIWVSKN